MAPVVLAASGQARLDVVIPTNASERIANLATNLSHYLGRMSGAGFAIRRAGQPEAGIVLGTASDFPGLAPEALRQGHDPLQRENYLLRSHPGGLLLLGATDLAAEHAAWDLLHRLGYRQFFPGETWEVVPPASDLSIAVDSLEKPDFHTRRIWYGHGLWKYNARPYREWCARNRAVPGFALSTSHMYQSLIRRRKEEFEAHPEYRALVDGKRQGTKLCISNPGLRALVVRDALETAAKNPGLDCISMEPSDGGGWCECEDCAAMGSISDRALTLANEVARALREASPGTHVGLLAYSQHSPPPTIAVEPNVIVKVQTAFIRGGYTFDELMTGWSERGASMGVGDYYSVFLWDYSRPASQKGSDLAYIRESLPRFHRQGARFFMSESSDLWGALGLGHYLASRLLWNLDEAGDYEALLDDFFTRAFGPAKSPMESFFRQIYRFDEDDRRPLVRGDMVARMYRHLDAAFRLAGDRQDILGRLDDLLLYTHYEELFQRYLGASGAARQEALNRLLRHTWRMRETMMVHAKPVFSRLASRDRNVTMPEREVYADETPFTREEKRRMLEEGIAANTPVEIGFETVEFSGDLVPARPLQLPPATNGFYNRGAPMGRQRFYTWRDEDDSKSFSLKASGGHIVHYRKFASPVQLSLFAEANPILDEPVAYDESVEPDGVEREVTLTSSFEGLHTLVAFPPSNRVKVEPVDPAMPWTLPSGLDSYNRLTSRWSLYFYVPRGTKTVGGYAAGSGAGTMLNASGEKRFDFSEMDLPGFFAVPVPPGEDGQLWKLEECSGRRALLTVPPYLAPSSHALLLPREVVSNDRRDAPPQP